MSVHAEVNLALLKEPFRTDAVALLESDEGDWVITYGFRTREEQAHLYAIWLKWLEDNPRADPNTGPRAAPPGQSAHEAALAIDFALRVNGVRTWQYATSPWRRIVLKIKAHPRLHSLDGIGDTDHMEAVQWRKLRG